MGEDVLHPAFLGHLAAVQNGDAGADLLDNAHLMGDDDHRDPQLLVQLLQKREDGIGGGGVQSGGGLIAEKHLRVRSQRPGDGHPLLLAAGELGGIGTCLFLQTHQIQQFQRLFLSLGLGYTGKLHGEADIFQTGPLHQQVEALEDHADLFPGLPQLLGGDGTHTGLAVRLLFHPRQLLTVDGDAAAGRPL